MEGTSPGIGNCRASSAVCTRRGANNDKAEYARGAMRARHEVAIARRAFAAGRRYARNANQCGRALSGPVCIARPANSKVPERQKMRFAFLALKRVCRRVADARFFVSLRTRTNRTSQSAIVTNERTRGCPKISLRRLLDR
jgi:hypothetical protein